MTPTPVALGLLLCDRVIIDKDTNSPSAIGIFTGLAVESFPTGPQRFSALAMLTDAQGDGSVRLAVHRLDEHWARQEVIYSTAHAVQFPDRFAVVNYNLRVRTFRFPALGSYEFVLFVDQDEVAHRRIRVYQAAPGTFVWRRISNMQCRSDFDYEKPTEATLSGIHLEVSDALNGLETVEQSKALQLGEPTRPRREDLFGVTFTVNDIEETVSSVSASECQST
jgi:hypothetical protein